MPIYEYRCESCGHVFEKLTLSKAEPGSAEPDPPCARCGHPRVARVHSAFSARTGGSSGASSSGPPAGGGGCGRPGGCGCH